MNPRWGAAAREGRRCAVSCGRPRPHTQPWPVPCLLATPDADPGRTDTLSVPASSYDNACNLLNYLLSREPLLATKFWFYVDKFHHKSHVLCGPFMSHANDPGTACLNSSIREAGNRCPCAYIGRAAAACCSRRRI